MTMLLFNFDTQFHDKNKALDPAELNVNFPINSTGPKFHTKHRRTFTDSETNNCVSCTFMK